MSRKLFAFLLSELKTVRVVCVKCGAATELSAEQLTQRQHYGCRYCNTALAHPDAMAHLGFAIRDLLKNDEFQIEFVLPDTASG